MWVEWRWGLLLVDDHLLDPTESSPNPPVDFWPLEFLFHTAHHWQDCMPARVGMILTFSPQWWITQSLFLLYKLPTDSWLITTNLLKVFSSGFLTFICKRRIVSFQRQRKIPKCFPKNPKITFYLMFLQSSVHRSIASPSIGCFCRPFSIWQQMLTFAALIY